MASASTPQLPPAPAHPRPVSVRPALRPILPKPPAIAPMDRAAAAAGTNAVTSASTSIPSTTITTATATTMASTAKGPAPTSLSHFGSRVIGSVASSIFAGSTTITLPPRPSASRSKAKKRTSPDRVIGTPSDTDKTQGAAASNAAALKKRRRAKLPTLPTSAQGGASVAAGSLKLAPSATSASSATSSASASTRTSSVASPAPDAVSSGPAGSVGSPQISSGASAAVAGTATPAAPVTPLRHTGSRPGIAIPHSTSHSESAATFSSAFDLDILSPDAFSLPAPSSDIWWPRLEDSSSIGLYDSDISISSSASSTLASATAAARRNFDRASSTSSLSSSLSSSTYFSDSTISTAISSIVIDEEPEFEAEPGKHGESEISDMIHRLIAGDDKPRSVDDEDEDEMLFAAPTNTSSVRQSRAESEGVRQQKRDPLRQLFSISSSISPKPLFKRSESTATRIPSPKPGLGPRAASEPASITIPAEKNSFEDESEKDFILNRELLVKKGLGKTKTSKHHSSTRFSSSSMDHITSTDSAVDVVAISGIINEDLFAEDDDAEMISSTTSHESGSMDIDVEGTSDVLFGALDDLGLVEDEQDPFTFLDVDGSATGNEVVESTIGW
ncbi:hypothetical protein V1525DRAFT_399570 [Lipomyces kononenkoae]|uniref:Uncharacterized protein n=1 Tax=Lipomyces kononenkoae TaxID=34357 RepID=A0ACC3T506_LIPKO